MSFPVLLRGESIVFPELAAEVVAVGKSGSFGDFGDGPFRIGQQKKTFLQAELKQIFIRRMTGRIPEMARQRADGHAGELCHPRAVPGFGGADGKFVQQTVQFQRDLLVFSAVFRPPQPGEPDVHGDHGKFCYSGYRHSLCHGWSAGVIPFLFRYILGVSITQPGYREVHIRPRLGGLDYVKATLPTPLGELTLDCRVREGRVHTDARVPDGIRLIVEEET